MSDTIVVDAGDWRHAAACLERPDINFFPERGEDSRPAKAICAGCPVRGECLAYALAIGEKHGVWGGTSAAQRRAVRRVTGRRSR